MDEMEKIYERYMGGMYGNMSDNRYKYAPNPSLDHGFSKHSNITQPEKVNGAPYVSNSGPVASDEETVVYVSGINTNMTKLDLYNMIQKIKKEAVECINRDDFTNAIDKLSFADSLMEILL